jgi:hypothetical protein
LPEIAKWLLSEARCLVVFFVYGKCALGTLLFLFSAPSKRSLGRILLELGIGQMVAFLALFWTDFCHETGSAQGLLLSLLLKAEKIAGLQEIHGLQDKGNLISIQVLL